MNVDLMRKIDHHLGVPLTFIGTGIVKLREMFRSAKTETPRNILFIELSEMGSTIIADPAMKRAEAHFNAQLFFVIFRKNKPSLDLLNTIPEENIFTLREDNLFVLGLDVLKFLYWCRKNRIDTAIDLELFSRVTALLTGFCGAERRVGFHNFHGEGLYRGNMMTHKVAYNPHIHIAKNFVSLVASLETKTPQIPYTKRFISDDEIQLQTLSFDAADQTAMHEHVQGLYPAYDKNRHRLILINPNASDLLPQRRWPKPNFIQLMKNILLQHDNALVLITGAPGEKEEAESLKQAVAHDRCINFAGQLKLGQMPLLYSISQLMVTNDSGPGHFSAITNLKTFVLFGPETPKLYGSLGNSTPIFAELACSPCVSAANHRKTPCTNPLCMDAITVEQVTNQVNIELSY